MLSTAYLREAECFRETEEVGKVAGMVGDQCSGSDDGLVTIQFSLDMCVGRQRPQEPGQSFHVAALLQSLTHSRHLVRAEPPQQRGHREHPVSVRQRIHTVPWQSPTVEYNARGTSRPICIEMQLKNRKLITVVSFLASTESIKFVRLLPPWRLRTLVLIFRH